MVAALSEDDERVVSEAADLWFHALLSCAVADSTRRRVEDELRRRER